VFDVRGDQMSRLLSRSHCAVIALVLMLALIGAGCTAESSDSSGARNFYESLDLASPSAAVETFADAFARKDFMTVHVRRENPRDAWGLIRPVAVA